MANYMGKDGFIWWQGVVEDRHDPLFLGRCRVRILGWHTDNKAEMPTESLPWSYPIQPITSAAQTGVGTSPTGPVEGTWVVGFFRDGEDAQEPVFFGTLGGIPEAQAPHPAKGEGFADPRTEEPPEDRHPLQGANRKLLKYDTDEEARVPRAPLKIIHKALRSELTNDDPATKRDISKTGSTSVESDSPIFQVILEEQATRSRYPDINFLGEPTTPRMARGLYGNFPTTSPLSQFGIVAQKKFWRQELGTGFSVAENSKDKWMEPDPTGIYGAKYPYNHVHQTESGHLIEMDDTPGFERLHRYHRTGTFEEIGSLGQRITKVVNEDYHIILNNDYWRVVGNRYESIEGKLDIFSTRGYFHKTEGSIEFDAKGSVAVNTPTDVFAVNAKDIILDAGGGALTMKAKAFNREIQTSKHTDKVSGDSTLKVGGEYACRAGSMQLSGRGQVGLSSGMGLNMVATTLSSITGGLGVEIAGILPSLNSGKFVNILGGTNLIYLGALEIGATGTILRGPGVPGESLSTVTLGADSVKLSYGLSAAENSITIGPSGIDIKCLAGNINIETLVGTAKLSGGLGASVESKLNAELKGTLNAKVEGSVMTTVKGGILMLN